MLAFAWLIGPLGIVCSKARQSKPTLYGFSSYKHAFLYMLVLACLTRQQLPLCAGPKIDGFLSVNSFRLFDVSGSSKGRVDSGL
jgi:hypothetical protein